MSVLNFRRFTRPGRLKSIAPRNLNQLLSPYSAWLQTRGYTCPSGDISPDYEALSQILVEPSADTPEELLEALFLIDEVSHGPNIDLLLKDVERSGMHFPVEEESSATDIAVLAYLLDPELLHRRHSMLILDRVRTYESYRPDRGPLTEIEYPDEEKLCRMAADMDSWFTRKRKGIGTRVMCTDSGPWLCLVIRHGDLFKREGAVATDGSDSCVLYRPERHDVVACHRGSGELRINGRTKGDKDLYRRVIGRYLFGDESFFPEVGPIYTLEPLRQDGRASLACLDVEGIERVTLQRLVLDWGGDQSERQTHQAGDLFALFEEKGESIPTQPEIHSAAFEVRFSDSRRPRRVTVYPPNRASFMRDGDGFLIEEWLRRREFAVKGAAGDDIIHREHILAGA